MVLLIFVGEIINIPLRYYLFFKFLGEPLCLLNDDTINM